MQNFSSMEIGETGRNHIIKNMVSSSGLPQEKIEKLFENFSYENNMDLTKINESFTSLLNPATSTFNFENFQKQIVDLSNQIVKPMLTQDERSAITEKMFGAISENFGVNVDVPVLLEVVCFILLLKNPKFEKVSEQIYFGKKSKDLFESETFLVNFTPINVSKENSEKLNMINMSEDKKLYESLKDILGRNNKRWGNNYHLDNAYQAIVNYLDNEIQEMLTKDNVYTITDTFEMDLINMLLKEKQLNPMYRSIDVLKTLLPDIQTVVFDLMLLINRYVVDNSEVIQFVSNKAYLDYIGASKNLFAGISSSIKTSKISFNKNLNNSEITELMKIDLLKVDIETYPVRLHSAVDMLHIIKSCETEFNLHLRKVINNYFTKTMNLLASTEKVILKSNRNKIIG